MVIGFAWTIAFVNWLLKKHRRRIIRKQRLSRRQPPGILNDTRDYSSRRSAFVGRGGDGNAVVKSRPGNFVISLTPALPEDNGPKQGQEVIPVYDPEPALSSGADQQPVSGNPELLWNAAENQNGHATPNTLEPIVTESSTLAHTPSRPSSVYDDDEAHGLDGPHTPAEVVALPLGTPSSLSSPLAQSNYFAASPKEMDRTSIIVLPPTPGPVRRDPNTSAGDYIEMGHYAVRPPLETSENGDPRRAVFDRSIFREYVEGQGTLTSFGMSVWMLMACTQRWWISTVALSILSLRHPPFLGFLQPSPQLLTQRREKTTRLILRVRRGCHVRYCPSMTYFRQQWAMFANPLHQLGLPGLY